MDQQSLVYLHISFAFLAFFLLLIRAFPLILLKKWNEKSNRSDKIVIGLQHLSYSVLVISGGILLWQNHFEIANWFYAKIVLFFVILSATTKAFKKQTEILLVQRQVGIMIAIIAFCMLFGLIMLKPQLG